MKKNLHLFLSYTIPSIIAMLIVGSYSIIDSIFIGQYSGPMGLAAAAITFPLVMMFWALGDMLGTGAAVIVSQSRGRHDMARARQIFGNMLMIQVVCAAVMIWPSLHFLPDILHLFGATPDLMAGASEYARIMILGCLVTMLNCGLGSVIRNDNRPVLSMMFIVIGLLMNIILDYVFIFVLDMGLAGAATATVISQTIGAMAQLTYFATRYTELRYGRDMFIMRPQNVRDIVVNGIPSFGNQLTVIAMLFLHNFQSLRYGGTNGLAVYTFIGAVESLGSLFMTGLSLGVQPLAAYLYGAKKYTEQNAIGNLGYLFAAVAGIVLMGVSLMGSPIFPHW
ncbi:MATE family efflux transporter, partial [bacterium]|nr:MATE family efflux transporter [bacterium]